MRKRNNSTTVSDDGIALTPDPKSGNYSAAFRVAGKYKRVGCGTTSEHKAYVVAKRKRSELEEKAKGANGKRVATIEQACGYFLAEHEPDPKAPDDESNLMKPDTFKMFQTMTNRIQGFVLNHLTGEKLYNTEERMYVDKNGKYVPALYSRPDQSLHDLDQEIFDEWVLSMRDIYRTGTLRVFISRIRTMMMWLQDSGFAVPDVRWTKHNKNLPESTLKSRPFTENEVKRYLNI